MERFQGIIGILAIFALIYAFSRARKHIRWRTLGVGLALQVAFALLVLKWDVGLQALIKVSEGVQKLSDFTNHGTSFVFGELFGMEEDSFIFALNVLPVIIVLGAIIAALYYLRVIQYIVHYVGTAINYLMGTSKVEGVYASTVIFLGQAEAPLVIAPPTCRSSRNRSFFTCMTGRFASVAGSTLLGYALLGAPLEFLLAASIMNAPGSLLVAKGLMPETKKSEVDATVKDVRDTESKNIIDAVGKGAMSGGKIAVTIGCLLIAIIAMLSAMIGGIGGWFGQDNWSLEGTFGIVFGPLAWAIGVPWQDAMQVGSFIAEKTIINESVGFTSFSEVVDDLDPKSVMLATFALAGFANLSSIAIQIGAIGGLAPERRADVAKMGPFALLGGFFTNMLNAAIVGIVAF